MALLDYLTLGGRIDKIAVTWATILARREMGESIKAIANDLEKVKLVRRSLKTNSEPAT